MRSIPDTLTPEDVRNAIERLILKQAAMGAVKAITFSKKLGFQIARKPESVGNSQQLNLELHQRFARKEIYALFGIEYTQQKQYLNLGLSAKNTTACLRNRRTHFVNYRPRHARLRECQHGRRKWRYQMFGSFRSRDAGPLEVSGIFRRYQVRFRSLRDSIFLCPIGA